VANRSKFGSLVQTDCYNNSVGAVLNAQCTTSGKCAKNNTYTWKWWKQAIIQ